jgi:hypothetical protein
MDLKVLLLGTISPIWPGQVVLFPYQAIRQTVKYAEHINWLVEVIRIYWYILPIGIQRDLQSIIERNPD